MTADNSTPGGRLLTVLIAPGVRQHLTIVGFALLVVGAMAMTFLPETAAFWLIVAVIVVAHTGLIMVAGSAVLRWLARRERHQE